MAIVLLITTNDEPTIEFPILDKCTVGRSSRCDLAIADKQMSANHGIFICNDRSQLTYSDLGSSNGSYLNNCKIQKVLMKVNDELRLGNTTIVIDDRKLNARERIAIGLRTDGNLEVSMAQNTNSINNASSSEGDKTPAGRSKENLIEPEPSSGKTKMLRLDINKHKKKKNS